MEINKSIEATLAECEAQISRNEVAKAHQTLQQTIQYGSIDDLLRLKGPLDHIISQFLPKRRKQLEQLLGERLAESSHHDISVPTVGMASTSLTASHAISDFEMRISERLRQLSDLHIFQWSTYYRDALQQVIADTLSIMQSGGIPEKLFEAIRVHFDLHAREIFTKGFNYVNALEWSTLDLSKNKSLAGLRSFLALPVEIYADQSARLSDPKDCRTLRNITSKMLSGILTGFTEASLSSLDTRELLRSTVKSWAHILPLLNQEEIVRLNSRLFLEQSFPILGEPLRTLAEAIDEASSKSSVDPVVILSATANLDDSCFDVALRAPSDSSDTKPLEISLLAGQDSLVRTQIEQRLKRGFIACLTSNSTSSIWENSSIPTGCKDIVVSIKSPSNDATTFLVDRLRLRFYEKTFVAQPGSTLRINVAERFPLENPAILAYFRVQRPSIRALETMISTRTGVLLWCSVRRSGKTTGVTELANSAERTSIVLQRCEASGSDPTARILFDSLCDHLSNETPLPRDFVRRHVLEAAPIGTTEIRRSVLIIDEYDRLFGRLRAAGRRNEDIRHLVIQPFLDQCVEFATDNLIVLLGQQPNAHYIYMDQNQLSAYIQQQPYPLFKHDSGSPHGEFWELLSKIFQQTLRFTPSFADCVFASTAGHPFLTVNVLRDFSDWLIKKKIVPSETVLTENDFENFKSGRFDSKSIGSSVHYGYFRSAAGEALSKEGQEDSPWLFAAYYLLRELARKGDQDLCISRSEIEGPLTEILDSVGLTTYSADAFLTSAAFSNFVTLTDEMVMPRIPILARIANTIRGN